MSEQSKFYQGFLLALRHYTETFPIDGPKFYQSFVNATKESAEAYKTAAKTFWDELNR